MKKMKVVVTVLFVFIGVQAALAQASVGIGLKAGLNFANISTTSAVATYNSSTGYHAGAFLKIKMTKFAIQPEVIYSKQGSVASFAGVNYESQLDYINCLLYTSPSPRD